jgi:hypothetical protein
MRRRAPWHTALAFVAAIGLLAPPPARAANGPAPAQTASPMPAPAADPIVIDVSLQGGGQVNGQLVGPNGLGAARQTVFFLRQGAMVGACQTDDAGRFALKGLTGGVYEVRSSQGGALLCRCWAPQTAPPSARPSLMFSTSSQVVRGQTGNPCPTCSLLKGPLPWIASIVTVVGLVVWDVTEEQHHRFKTDHPPSS